MGKGAGRVGAHSLVAGLPAEQAGRLTPGLICSQSIAWGGAVFSLKRQGDFRLQLTRVLTQPGRHQVELYLFTPHETTVSPRTLAESQFFYGALAHRFRLLGLPA